MSHMLQYDPVEELRLLIDRQHLGYLQSEKREKERPRLEVYMREFLNKSPHSRKFTYPQAAEVLRRSILSQKEFCGERAARAFAALAKYADNLIVQPWRKEFREVKLYCGFYKHEVEAALVGAEQILEAMGYQHTGNSTMMLPGVLDPDRVICVSKDAMLAMVECTIIQQIWEALSRHRVKWSEILEFRENYICSPENVISALNYRVHERMYQQQTSHRPRATPCSYGVYYGNHPVHHSSSQPYPVPRYAHIVSPQQIVPPPTMYQSPVLSHYPHQPILKPHEMYPSNGYHNHNHNPYPNVPQPPPQHNGYSLPTHGPYSQRPSVPTAQLIELTHETSAQLQNPYPVPEPIHTPEFPSSKAKDDGAGSWENWDYVYRNLESQGYRKETNLKDSHHNLDIEGDFGERMRGLNLNASARSQPPAATPPKRLEAHPRTDGDGEAKQRLRKNSNDLEDVTKHKLNKSSLKTNCDETGVRLSKVLIDEVDASAKKKINQEGNRVERNGKGADIKSDVCLSVASARESPVVASNMEPPHVVTLDVSPKFLQDVSPVVELPPENGKWECVTCTFLNVEPKNICEMCGKSRAPGLEQIPQPCGGQVCPQCTLVNKKGKNFCEACSTPLKDSPTYI